jgi:succinoglycan biosynthesis protein ExoA
MPDLPFVSVIVPCFNEQATIVSLLRSIYAQDYPLKNLEVIIADGMSTDRTREEIHKAIHELPDLAIRLVDNHRRVIPSALNRALEAAKGEIIVRLDAHCIPDPAYIRLSVDVLSAGVGDNVGGIWEIQPGGPGWMAESIARAASHRLGIGDASYRYASQPAAVDTVPFGAYHRRLIERIGPYDETLLSNEDYEFNARIRQSGGVVWLDPRIRSQYFARADLGGLARQYWRYGYWKLRMLRRYPKTLRWRQALPPLFLLGLAGLALSGFLVPFSWKLGCVVLVFYLLVLICAGLGKAIQHRKPALLPGLPLAIMTMHFTWGAGFLWSLASLPFDHSGSRATDRLK